MPFQGRPGIFFSAAGQLHGTLGTDPALLHQEPGCKRQQVADDPHKDAEEGTLPFRRQNAASNECDDCRDNRLQFA